MRRLKNIISKLWKEARKPKIVNEPSGLYTGNEIIYDKYIESIKSNINLNPKEWNFKSSKDYRFVLEHLDQKMGQDYLDVINAEFHDIYTSNKELLIKLSNKNDFYGKTIKFHYPNFSECSPTNFRYILHSFMILKFIKENNLINVNFIEIGGGYGGLAFYINNLVNLFGINIESYSIFDLSEVSMLQDRYLKALKIKNYHCFQLDNFNNLKANSFLISNYAYSEISTDLQKEYTDKVINPFTSYGFLTWNFSKVHKFIDNKVISIKRETPLTHKTNFYVTFKP
jgi:hypothetical protein